MGQLTLGLLEKSKVRVLAQANKFRIELVEKLGRDDVAQLYEISDEMAEIYGEQARLDSSNLKKYFNSETLPFVARLNDEIIGYIIGVPLEYFNDKYWIKFDTYAGKKNTIYTFAFVIKSKYKKRGGYAKSLKRVYINWARKEGYSYLTGHVKKGIAQNFSDDTVILNEFLNWYGLKTPFEYYRRPLHPIKPKKNKESL